MHMLPRVGIERWGQQLVVKSCAAQAVQNWGLAGVTQNQSAIWGFDLLHYEVVPRCVLLRTLGAVLC